MEGYNMGKEKNKIINNILKIFEEKGYNKDEIEENKKEITHC